MRSGHFGKHIRNTWEILECDAREEWRKPVGPIVWEMRSITQSQWGEEYPIHNGRWKSNSIGYMLQRNCLLKHIIEGKIHVMERRRRKYMQLLDDLKETRRYGKLKEEALDNTVWSTCFGKDSGSVVRQTAGRITSRKQDDRDPRNFMPAGYRAQFCRVQSGRSLNLTSHVHPVPHPTTW